ncbi:MAG: hypothetical protein MUE41_10785, partial [Gemmatimonadaceae bacterium]|nr:hypothetical protein [Gemmatimonadaceae bacterium]
MTVGALVDAVAARLAESPALAADAVDDIRQEAVRLVADRLGQPRHWPRSAAREDVDVGTVAAVLAAADRRVRGEPLAYATGVAGFR